jgi:tetratricopeptide (TPR) repeat protein
MGVLCKQGLLLVLASEAGGQQTRRLAIDTTSAKQETSPSLDLADLYLRLGDTSLAAARILSVLGLQDSGGARKLETEEYRQLEALANSRTPSSRQDSTSIKHASQIDHAMLLASEGRFDDAATELYSVLSESKDKVTRSRAELVLTRIARPTYRLAVALRLAAFWAAKWLLLLLSGILFLVLGAHLVRQVVTEIARRRGPRWRLGPVADATELGLGAAMLEALRDWSGKKSGASAGLLRLGSIQIPPMPLALRSTSEVDPIEALKDVKVDVGSISLGGLNQLFRAAQAWLVAKLPRITGRAMAAGEDVYLTIKVLKPGEGARIVSARASKSQMLATIQALTFKAYYMLALGVDVNTAESAEEMRQGLLHLCAYAEGHNARSLEEALPYLARARRAALLVAESLYYEGVILDLLERAQQAIARFEYVRSEPNVGEGSLRLKATYNLAVSHLRTYNPLNFEPAYQLLDSIIGSETDIDSLIADPLAAFSVAAQANITAHKPIFWQEFCGHAERSMEPTEILRRKDQAGFTIRRWICEVETTCDRLEKVFEGSVTRWDQADINQLRWALENARGNILMNVALFFLVEPHVAGRNEELEREALLRRAHSSFVRCELLGPPTIETLANLETVLFALDRDQEGEEYFQRAIQLNPRYEYAYYRFAQQADKRGATEDVVRTLEVFSGLGKPQISGMKKLYSKYSQELGT